MASIGANLTQSLKKIRYLLPPPPTLPPLLYSLHTLNFANLLLTNDNHFTCRSSNIIWVDLEMTGLDIEKDFIMEMACIVTDKNLNLVAEGPSLVIHQVGEVFCP